MTHNTLTDYQIATAFGDTLSLIYKEKMRELHEDLEPIYAHLDRLDIPKYSDLDRLMARASIPAWAQDAMESIKHIKKIRALYKRIKNTPEGEGLDIAKAKAVPIETLYDFKRRGKNVACPFHTDLHPSASIKYNKLVCFQCGRKLDTIALFQALHNVGFKDAVKALSN